MSLNYTLNVNGSAHQVEDAWMGETLLYVLRERLGLFGTKNACEQGECGSCSVTIDGRLICSCLQLAATATDCEIRTIEGTGSTGALDAVQTAMYETGAVQCGFCTPGFVMAVNDLLERSADPTDSEVREAISGNLCRCTGYGRILEAIQIAVRDRQERS